MPDVGLEIAAAQMPSHDLFRTHSGFEDFLKIERASLISGTQCSAMSVRRPASSRLAAAGRISLLASLAIGYSLLAMRFARYWLG